MRKLIICSFVICLAAIGAAAQSVYTPEKGSAERKAILDALPTADVFTLFHFPGSVSPKIESRTIITSGLVLLSVLALVLFGGEVLKSFSLALLVGVILGTYSTIAIASPIAIWWQNKLGDSRVKPVLAPERGEKLASSSRRSVTRRPVTR